MEGAFVTLSGRKNLNQQNEKYTFIPIADNILLVQSLQKFALIDDYTGCSYGSSGCTFDPVGDRIYNLGGLWLIYDPRYTLAWNQIDPGNGDPFMTDGDGNFDGLVAEYNIVPTQPYQTATGTDTVSYTHLSRTSSRSRSAVSRRSLRSRSAPPPRPPARPRRSRLS